MDTKIFLAALAAVAALAGATAVTAKTVKVKLKEPGTLSTRLPMSKIKEGSDIAIEGAMNNDDVRYLREICGSDTLFRPIKPLVAGLDLSKASFAKGGSSWFAKGSQGGLYSVSSAHTMPDGLFSDCPITKIVLPSRLDSIRRIALRATKITELYIPDGVYVDPYALFLDTCLTTLRLPAMPKAISPTENRLTAIRSLTYGDTDLVSGGSFVGLNALEEIVFDGMIGHIDGYTVTDCPNLKRVAFNGPICTTGGLRFTYDCPSLEEITVGDLALNYSLVQNEGADRLKGIRIEGAVFETGDSVAVPATTAAEILARQGMKEQFMRLAEWQIDRLTADDSGFLRITAFEALPASLAIADAGGMTELAERLTHAREKALTFDELKTHLQILKDSPDYKPGDGVEWTTTYTAASDSMLSLTRERFNLDSIAGNGNDISRIKNLLYWVHDLVPHDGGSAWPECGLNCREIYDVCKREDRGVNCRIMAMMLTEALLAEGIPAKYITCQPKAWDTDNDCHVICVAWSDSLGKWVWIDPTFAAYVTDENGMMLHPGEVRHRLRNDMPLVLNEDANWNHRILQTKEDYLEDYMAKNLYILSYNTINQANPEGYATHPQGEHVVLIPSGARFQGPRLITTDEAHFWEPPY